MPATYRDGKKDYRKEKSGLNIAMLGHKRIPSREGGIEVVVEELSTRMVKLGHHVTCFNRSGQHVSGKQFTQKAKREYKGVRLKYVPTIDRRGWAAMTSSITAAIRAAFGNYDVVHFHAEGPCAMIWLPKLFRKRCIATIHGLDHRRVKWGRLAQAYILLGEWAAVRWADEIIVLSKSVQEYFWEKYKRETHWIPNGVSRSQLKGSGMIERNLGLKQGEYILYVGRLVPEKGLSYLIRAYQEMHIDKKLVVAGGGSDAYEFEMHIREQAKNNPNIIFAGFVQGEMLEELYSNAYLFVLPSDLEGMPLTLLEAMSFGRCCLTSDIPECTEVIEDRGVVFERGNVQDLEEKLQILCEHPETVQRYMRDAADFICEKYNWDDVVGQTIQVYKKSYRGKKR